VTIAFDLTCGKDEDKVQDNRLCFTVGAWVKIGNPAATAAPTDETAADCSRSWRTDKGEYVTTGSLTTDCWRVCGPEDALTAENKACMIRETDAVLPVIQRFLRVPKLKDDRLKFSYSEGSYPSYFEMTGNENGAQCFADCAKHNDVGMLKQMPDSYCTEGIDGDVVLFLFKGLKAPGVAGYGGACGHDQYGRPVGIVFNWMSDCETKTDTEWKADLATRDILNEQLPTLINTQPGDNLFGNGTDGRLGWRLVVHEVFHGLGFNAWTWLKSQAIEFKDFVDTDAHVDSVYAFKKGTKTHALMQQYYSCYDDSTQLPLMGYPDMGRDSHHSNRLNPEDLLAYTNGKGLTLFTLTMMEDTGFYIANYSLAMPMYWGRNQGCDFVSSRCETRRHDHSVDVTNNIHRHGNVWAWSAGATLGTHSSDDYAHIKYYDPGSQDMNAALYVRGLRTCAPIDCGTYSEGWTTATDTAGLADPACGDVFLDSANSYHDWLHGVWTKSTDAADECSGRPSYYRVMWGKTYWLSYALNPGWILGDTACSASGWAQISEDATTPQETTGTWTLWTGQWEDGGAGFKVQCADAMTFQFVPSISANQGHLLEGSDGRLYGDAECYNDANTLIKGHEIAGFCYTTPLESATLAADGYAGNQPCEFPFVYDGVEYSSCITDGYHAPWCMTDAANSKWGVCKHNCPMDGANVRRRLSAGDSGVTHLDHYHQIEGNGWCDDEKGTGPFGDTGLIIHYSASTRETQDYCDAMAECIGFSSKFVKIYGTVAIIHTSGSSCEGLGYFCADTKWADDPSLITKTTWTTDFTYITDHGTASWLLNEPENAPFSDYSDAKCYVKVSVPSDAYLPRCIQLLTRMLPCAIF
jgi:hypothetical protein